uniref:No apical meristem-associated C-terminal domain-containing protein n=1 Tax=Brassica oleracea var. oleracea TaxID=109376 RepID=A0A0D3C4B2_BRAOL
MEKAIEIERERVLLPHLCPSSSSHSFDALSDPSIKELAEQIAKDPTFTLYQVHQAKSKRVTGKWLRVIMVGVLYNNCVLVIGNEQKAIAFWKRIAFYFASSPKLVGCYEAAVKQKSSGQSEDDVMKMAHAIFFNDHKKWCGVSKENLKSKRRKIDDQSAQSSTSVPVGEEEAVGRPAGVKAAKAKNKRSVSKEEGVVDFQKMWEIRERDYVMKDKLNKQKILDSLIKKIEPLTETEIALKNKLINDMLAS